VRPQRPRRASGHRRLRPDSRGTWRAARAAPQGRGAASGGIGVRLAGPARADLMPSYGELVDTVARWRELPAPERADSQVAAALTFDDGPDPDGTPLVLDALDAAGIKATFFVVGEQLMRHHAIARDALARGHELALHGFEHVEHGTL